MYTSIDFKTKKELKQAVKSGAAITVFQPGIMGSSFPDNGSIVLEGPHYPRAHTWYATAVLKNGHVSSVK